MIPQTKDSMELSFSYSLIFVCLHRFLINGMAFHDSDFLRVFSHFWFVLFCVILLLLLYTQYLDHIAEKANKIKLS